MRSLEAEAVLLARAQHGDRHASWSLIAPCVNAVYELARRLVRTEEDAEAVVQEACLGALSAIGGFRGHGRFLVRLQRITVDQALMKLGMRRKDVFSTGAKEEGEIECPRSVVDWSGMLLGKVGKAKAVEVLESAIAELPIGLRTVLVLRDINGLSNVEAAQALGLATRAVKWRVHRARCLLRARLSDYYREGPASRKSVVKLDRSEAVQPPDPSPAPAGRREDSRLAIGEHGRRSS